MAMHVICKHNYVNVRYAPKNLASELHLFACENPFVCPFCFYYKDVEFFFFICYHRCYLSNYNQIASFNWIAFVSKVFETFSTIWILCTSDVRWHVSIYVYTHTCHTQHLHSKNATTKEIDEIQKEKYEKGIAIVGKAISSRKQNGIDTTNLSMSVLKLKFARWTMCVSFQRHKPVAGIHFGSIACVWSAVCVKSLCNHRVIILIWIESEGNGWYFRCRLLSLARSLVRPPSLFYMHDNFAIVACRFHQTHFICMSSVQVRETLCSQWQKKFFVARLDVWTMHCHMMRIRMPTEYFIVSCCFRNCNCNFHRTNSKTACVIWFDILKNWCKTFH